LTVIPHQNFCKKELKDRLSMQKTQMGTIRDDGAAGSTGGCEAAAALSICV